MAGESQLSVFITANIASFQEQLNKALASFQGTVSGMKAAGVDLSGALARTTVDAASAFNELNPAIQESAANYLQVREALQGVTAALRETEAVIADAGGINGVNNDIIAQWSAETTSQILLQKELTSAMVAYKAAINDTFVAQQNDIKMKQEQVAANRQVALSSAEAAMAEYEANTGAAASEAEATAEENARTAALARLIGLKEADAASSRTQTVAQVEETQQASAGYQRLAAAKIAATRAQQELSAAQSNAVDLIGLEGETTNTLALAMERASVASVELTAAQDALKVAVAESGGSASLFRSRMILGENGIRAFLTSTLTSLPLIAGIFAATFAVTATNAMKDATLQLADLSRATGVGVASLTELGQSAAEMGAKTDDLTSLMRRLDTTISMAASGGATQIQILKELGVDTEQWRGTIPPTITVLAQMADYLHLNAGNAETMRAGMRALGADSPALLAWLAQGSTAITGQAGAYAMLGKAEQDAVANSRDLQKQEQQLSAMWDGVKLSLIGATNAMLGWLFVNKPSDGDIIDQGVHQIALAWQEVTGSIDAAIKSNSEYMRGVLSGAVAAPKGVFGAGGLTVPTPPDIATAKASTDKKKAATPFASEMSEFREELSQREASFDGSHLEMLQTERDFWERIIDEGRAKGKDVVAVQTEIARATVAINKEATKEQLDADRDRGNEEAKSRSEAGKELAASLAAERNYNRAYTEEVKGRASLQIADLQAQIANENILLGVRRTAIEQMASLDDITYRQKIAGLGEVAAAEETVQLKALQGELAILNAAQAQIAGLKGEERAFIEMGTRIEEVYKKIGELGAQTWARNTNEATQSANIIAQRYTADFALIETGFRKAIDGMIQENQKFSKSMAQMWDQIVLSTANSLAKMLLEFVKHSIQQVIITQQTQTQQTVAVTSGVAAQTTARAAGNSASLAQDLATSLKSIVIAAKKAAAWAYSGTLEAFGGMPWAIPLAAAAAAVTFAAVAAFGAAGSAKDGAMLSQDTLVQAHAGEMIVPAHITGQLNRALSLPGSTASGLSNLANSVGSGSTRNQRIHIENTFNEASKVDQDTITQMMRAVISRGSLT